MTSTFVLIGGNEDIYPREPVFRAIGSELDTDSRIRIFPTASSYPESTSETYCHQFESMGFTDVKVVRVLSKKDSDDPTFVNQASDADALFFIGGDQSRLTKRVRNTALHDALLERIGEDIVISGTSAGAMALCETMIAGGSAGNAMRKGEIPLRPGLGLLPSLILDTHFIARNRFYRLVHALSENPDKTGIGITNDTGIVIKNDLATVMGTDVVSVLRANGLAFNTAGRAKKYERLGAGPFHLMVVPFGYKIDLKNLDICEASVDYPLTHH